MIPFNSKADIERETKTSDGPGGWTSVWNILHNDLACRINWSTDKGGGYEKIQFDKETYFRDAKVYCNIIDITTKDRFVYDSKTYEITSVANPDNMNWYLVFDIRLIE